MKSNSITLKKLLLLPALLSVAISVTYVGGAHAAVTATASEMRFIQVAAATREDRSAITNSGMSIEAVRSDSVWGFANENSIRRLKLDGRKIIGNFDYQTGRGGHQDIFGFPVKDAKFHDYNQTVAALRALNAANPDISRVVSIGKTTENRDMWAIHINTSQEALDAGTSTKPGALYMGNHHAREHVSNEIPLMLAQYLLAHRADAAISSMLDSRDIWIIPMVNPDGAEWDITTGTSYKWWRKNRRDNGDGTFGVDLNRNYGFRWGTGGSDKQTSSDIYMGPAPFSEPETQNVKAFIDARPNFKVLLSFHTFSELILYPWGTTFEPIGNNRDHAVFEKMARTMAGWNHYTPEQSSSLYITSGDTTDWAYGEHGIFAFTFELSPKSMWNGGFYPGQDVINQVFQDNLKPCLYLLQVAADPYQVTSSPRGALGEALGHI